MDSSTRNLPTTISPILLQPALYYVPPPEENKGENLAGANGTFSAAEKGKGKAVHFPDDIPAEPPFPEPDELLSEGHPSLDFPVSKQVPLNYILHTVTFLVEREMDRIYSAYSTGLRQPANRITALREGQCISTFLLFVR